ncbi:MAG: hypothetical protein KDA22_12995 [Phycisphaerales bacterium]|nr:hypothetical protein [Phycisphaerales bacterium]
MIAFAIVVAVVAALILTCLVFERRQQHRLAADDHAFRAGLEAAGRTASWETVEARLRAGEGTLLVQLVSPKGPVREWWTTERFRASCPCDIPASKEAVLQLPEGHPYLEFTERFVKQALDPEDGVATLTEAPQSSAYQQSRAKYTTVGFGNMVVPARFDRERRLERELPGASVVTVIEWFGIPLVIPGDARTALLGEGSA